MIVFDFYEIWWNLNFQMLTNSSHFSLFSATPGKMRLVSISITFPPEFHRMLELKFALVCGKSCVQRAQYITSDLLYDREKKHLRGIFALIKINKILLGMSVHFFGRWAKLSFLFWNLWVRQRAQKSIKYLEKAIFLLCTRKFHLFSSSNGWRVCTGLSRESLLLPL